MKPASLGKNSNIVPMTSCCIQKELKIYDQSQTQAVHQLPHNPFRISEAFGAVSDS
jgi:hypothetical protein